LEALLNVIRKSIPIGIITTKDLPFIIPRTLFAYGWGAIAGLEMRVGSQLFFPSGLEKTLSYLIQSLIYAKQNVKSEGIIEEKCDYKGLPLAFCVDWRQMKNEKEARAMSSQILSYCKSFPLEVIEYPGKPYFDVYPCAIDKGKTLISLKEKFDVHSDVIYMGDSITDNAAFREADISIGVSEHRQPANLECRYWIKFEDVACFLNFLLRNDFQFSPDLPGIKIRG